MGGGAWGDEAADLTHICSIKLCNYLVIVNNNLETVGTAKGKNLNIFGYCSYNVVPVSKFSLLMEGSAKF